MIRLAPSMIASLFALGCIAQQSTSDPGDAGPPPGELTCDRLTDDQCRARTDCQHTGLRCVLRPTPCAELPPGQACDDAGCYDYDGACHDTAPGQACDQPDPASCEAAGCAWSDAVGCAVPGDAGAACELVPENRCGADPRCRLVESEACMKQAAGAPADEAYPPCTIDRRCAPNDGPCPELSMGLCEARPDCEWAWDRGCGTLTQGCAEVAPHLCEAEPACVLLTYEDCGEAASGPSADAAGAEAEAPAAPDAGMDRAGSPDAGSGGAARPACPDCDPIVAPSCEIRRCADRATCEGLGQAACGVHPGCMWNTVPCRCGTEGGAPGDEEADCTCGAAEMACQPR